jgi:arsenical pump membrane protein
MFLFFQIPAITRMVLISLITLLTLLGIMLRPWKVSEAITALTGAGLLLLLGLLSPGVALGTLVRDWNTFFFFLGMMSLAALTETAGLFDWLAVQAARLSGSSSRRLFFNTFLLGSLISMLLSNDATALILTPIVYSLVTRLRLPVLPYLFACTFIADSASFLLPVSNPINILITSQFPLNLLTFLRLLFLPSLLVIGINAGFFYFLYQRQLHGRFDIKRLPVLQETMKHPIYFRYTCIVVILVAVAYVIAAAFQIPLCFIAVSGSLLLLLGALYWKQTTLWSTARQISWPIFGFIAGMFLVVQALETTGLTALFGQLLLRLSGGTSFGAVMVGTLGSALGTNLVTTQVGDCRA